MIALAGYVTIFWELSFCVLVWNRLLRPLVLAGAVLLHVGIGLLMGLPTFGVMMLIGCASFVDPAWLRRRYARAFVVRGRLALVYDGLCPLCIRAASLIKTFDVRDQVKLVDFNQVKPSKIHRDLDHATCMQAMQVVTAGGNLASGFYAFRVLARRLRLLWPLVPLVVHPRRADRGSRRLRAHCRPSPPDASLHARELPSARTGPGHRRIPSRNSPRSR